MGDVWLLTGLPICRPDGAACGMPYHKFRNAGLNNFDIPNN